MTRWISRIEVIELNKIAVKATNEPFGIISAASLEGALGRPQSQMNYAGEQNLGALAGWLLISIARAHAFAQGNKRTGLLAATSMLYHNGWTLDADDIHLAELIIDTVEHRLTDEGFVEIFRRFCRYIP